MEILKVSAKSNPNSVAGALAGVLRERGAWPWLTVFLSWNAQVENWSGAPSCRRWRATLDSRRSCSACCLRTARTTRTPSSSATTRPPGASITTGLATRGSTRRSVTVPRAYCRFSGNRPSTRRESSTSSSRKPRPPAWCMG